MPIELRWIVSTVGSALHEAAVLFAGKPLVDPQASAALAPEVAALCADLAVLGLDPRSFFEHAIPLSVRFDTPSRLAEAIIAKCYGPRPTTGAQERLARRLTVLETTFHADRPGALEELELRAGPLGEQWEARGPGLMATVARLTEADLIVSQADVILVQPATGGGGAAHMLYNSVHIEAVLANPIDALPEVARLGWLLLQLNLDLPKYADPLRRNHLTQVGPLAMIPPLLAAAQEVELARFDDATLAAALAAWDVAAIEPAVLVQWWQTYQESSPSWTVALAALDRMLEAEPLE
jgi:hypothetical protein